MLEYTGVRVRDLAKSRRFYSEGLGLRSIRAGRMAAGGQWEELQDPESLRILELNYYPDNPPYREGDELDHLGFRVDDLDAILARLVSLGAKVRIPPFVEQDSRIAFLSDGDGIWIELYESLGSAEAPTSRGGD